MSVWVPEPHLGDVLAYDLDQTVRLLDAERREHPDGPAFVYLRSALAVTLSWDQSFRNCWEDPWFVARYTLIRRTVLERLGGNEQPTIREMQSTLAALVLELARAEEAHDAQEARP